MGATLPIDLTLLKATATRKDIRSLCLEAKRLGCHAVCVNPCRVREAKRALAGSGVAVCSVVGFPLGASRMEAKLLEARMAVQDGASEIDVVMNIGLFLEGGYAQVLRELRSIVKAVRGKDLVKVIIEAGYLTDRQVVKASKLVARSGADFIKTSTGYPGLPPASPRIIATIRKAAPSMRIKASGGIRTMRQYERLLAAGADRIGASRRLL